MKSFFRVGVALSLATVASFALVADYRYSECSGVSIKNHAGSDLNGQLSSTGASLTSGESTLSLLGTGSMSVEHNSKLDLVKSMTLSLWVKQEKRGQQALITRGEGQGDNRKFAANGEYFLSVNSSGKVRYKHNGISGTYSDNAIPLNTWTHIVVTREHNEKKLKIYINSTLDSTSTYSDNPTSSNSEKLLIGKCSGCGSTEKFEGRLDEVKIYNKALSNSAIIELFEAEDEGVHREATCAVTPNPTAINDREEVFTTGDIQLNILDNDIDNNTEDNCNIQPDSIILSALAGAEVNENQKIMVVDNEGMWSVENTGTITFTPDEGYTNSPTPINYSISDSCGNNSEEATITLIRQQTNPADVDGENDANDPLVQDNANAVDDLDGTHDNVAGQDDANDPLVQDNANAVDDLDGTHDDVAGQNDANDPLVQDNANAVDDLDGTHDDVAGQNDANDPLVQDNANAGNAQGDTNANAVGGQNTGNVAIVNGKDGLNGTDGVDGKDGLNGTDGVDGKDGVCPTSCGKDEHSKSCDCDCETYETSVPVLSSAGMGLMFFISTLFGMFLFRKETLLTK